MSVMLLTFLISALTLSYAQAATDWSEVIDQGDSRKITFGVEIGGTDSYSRNGDHSVAPASVTKVFTAAAVMERLGGDYRFKTRVQWNVLESKRAGSEISDLTLLGSADPSWGLKGADDDYRAPLRRLAEHLKKIGVIKVRGEIQLRGQDARLDRMVRPAWETEDWSACYGVDVQTFNLAENCAYFTVTGLKTGTWNMAGLTELPRLELRPGSSNAFSVSVLPGTTPEARPVVVIRGTYRANSTASRVVKVPVYDTRPWVKGLLALELKSAGIELDSAPSDAPIESIGGVTMLSQPLSRIIAAVLKPSSNLGAEALLRVLGLEHGPKDQELLDASLAALRAHLETVAYRLSDGDRMLSELLFYDGSGLSRMSRVTASATMSFLRDLQTQPYFFAMWSAFTIAGVDGTLALRMKGTAAEGWLRGKTGTLRGYYQLAGFVPLANGAGFIPFVMLSDTVPDYRFAARASADRVGARLASLSKSGKITIAATP
jgi:D-alanyl-D-alanine carboxypeptidase/D-alanyl-D-alanine-endopeptidase (penicillin-binding protein 4)